MKRVNQQLAAAQPIRIANPGSKEIYRPKWAPLRPGADQHEEIPSRIGDKLVYRDGRKDQL